jgi:hypothetical protein
MSFGWSAGDIFTAVQLLWEIGQALSSAKGSPLDRSQANGFVKPIEAGLTQLREYAQEEEEGLSNFDSKEVSAFRPTVDALKPLAKEFTDKVLEYSGLNEELKRKRDWWKKQYEKLKWHFIEKEDLLQLRNTIQAHFAVLGALYPKMIL